MSVLDTLARCACTWRGHIYEEKDFIRGHRFDVCMRCNHRRVIGPEGELYLDQAHVRRIVTHLREQEREWRNALIRNTFGKQEATE